MNIDQLQLLGLAMAPSAVIITYVWFHDRQGKEPLTLLGLSFLLGCLSIIPAILLEFGLGNLGLVDKGSLQSVALFAFVTVGFSEELSKFFFLRLGPYRSKHFNEPYDGIMYSMMIGMGFATVENLMYIFGQETYALSLQVAQTRAWTAVPAHATFAAMMGYFAGLARFKQANQGAWLLAGLLLATVFHGAYDFFLMQQWSAQLTAGALVSLVIGVWLSWKAIRLHRRVRPHDAG